MSSKKGERSKWEPVFFTRADKPGICDTCSATIKEGDMIFFFPRLKKGKRGTVYCFKCFIRKVQEISVSHLL